MVTVMEMSSGKVLDEACNHYNDVYSDEVLYASWAEAPRAAPAAGAQASAVDGQSFMARLYASQGQQDRDR